MTFRVGESNLNQIEIGLHGCVRGDEMNIMVGFLSSIYELWFSFMMVAEKKELREIERRKKRKGMPFHLFLIGCKEVGRDGIGERNER